MSFDRRPDTERWIREDHLSLDYVTGFFEPPAVPMVGVGVERYSIKSHFDADVRPSYSYAECHADGACVAVRQLNSRDGDGTVMGSSIVLAAATCLHVVGAHAARAGAFGDAAIHVRAVGEEMRLGYLRDGLVQHYPTALDFQEVHSRHTFPLQPLSVAGRDLFLAVRQSVGQMFNGFGRAEVPHISDDGTLRLAYFDDTDFTGWARSRDLPTTEERVEE